jgi:hypothetical protein
MLKRVFAGLLSFKPGAGTYIGGGLALFLCMIVGGQYFSTGQIDIKSMVDSGPNLKDFFVRNPRLKFVDSYPRTSLIQVRDNETGRHFILDIAVVRDAEVRPEPCEDHAGAAGTLAYPPASEITCFGLILPNTASPAYRSAASFKANAKDGKVAQYYQEVFRGLGKKPTVIQDSSRAIILEAEDGDQNTVARVAIRGSFDTAYGFLAVTSAP